jgi:hypothetical protein
MVAFVAQAREFDGNPSGYDSEAIVGVLPLSMPPLKLI